MSRLNEIVFSIFEEILVYTSIVILCMIELNR